MHYNESSQISNCVAFLLRRLDTCCSYRIVARKKLQSGSDSVFPPLRLRGAGVHFFAAP
jgi:hypothetical protein